MFDYIFYRFYTLYKKKEGFRYLSSASSAITFIQITLLFSVVLTFNILTSGLIPFDKLWGDTAIDYIIVGALVLLLDLFNYLKYKKKKTSILIRYKNHRANKWFRNWMLFLIPILIVTFPFIVRVIFIHFKKI